MSPIPACGYLYPSAPPPAPGISKVCTGTRSTPGPAHTSCAFAVDSWGCPWSCILEAFGSCRALEVGRKKHVGAASWGAGRPRHEATGQGITALQTGVWRVLSLSLAHDGGWEKRTPPQHTHTKPLHLSPGPPDWNVFTFGPTRFPAF